MEFFATHQDFVVIWRREAIEGGGRLEDAMAEHMRPFLERAIAFLEREVEAGRLRAARPGRADAARLRGGLDVLLGRRVPDAADRRGPDDAGGARALRGARSPRCCGTRWLHVEPAAAERLGVDHGVRVAGALIASVMRVLVGERAVEVLAATSRRPRMPWWRTRMTGKPSALTACSARSIRRERLRVDAVPYGMREARHGLAGFSALGSRRCRASSRTCALVTSISGCRTSCSAAAFRPGRQSP